MKERRELMQSVLGENEVGITLPNFPLLGVPDSTWPPTFPGGPVANSLYTSDDVIHPHHRFSTLTRNIRLRRGSNVAINVPIFKDEHTVMPTYDAERREGREALDGHIYLDSMAFGMGMHCLQCTFQTCNLREARSINDQFTALAPIMLALTAGTPFLRGMVSDSDVRWQVISGSVDDRTPSERGLAPLGTDRGVRVINKSRYDSIDSFLSLDHELYRPEYDDLNLVYDEKIYERLRAEGIDEQLAKHVAHLFIRDPLVIYSDKIELDDEKVADHFENIQSTNWQTVRFKPPPPGAPIGWRVEFRPMEIQATDFENAAFVIFIVLLTRLIGSIGINLYIPISKIDENMKRAHARDAVLTQKFYWRKNVVRPKPKTDGCHKPNLTPASYRFRSQTDGTDNSEAGSSQPRASVDEEYEEMTIHEIFSGKGDYPGLIPLVTHYCDNVNIDSETRSLVDEYLSLISKRASGELKTFARWQRDFVASHPDYKNDSIITPSINYDLITTIADIEAGRRSEPSLLGNPRN
jgi:glutamate--cysteine ligase catalytic subunit